MQQPGGQIATVGGVQLLNCFFAHLNHGAAKWQLYGLDEREETIQELDTSDCGNLATRLLHCWDLGAVRGRFASQIEHISSYCPDAETTVISPAEISFRFRGL